MYRIPNNKGETDWLNPAPEFQILITQNLRYPLPLSFNWLAQIYKNSMHTVGYLPSLPH